VVVVATSRKAKVEALVNSVADLKPLPTTVTKALRLIDKDSASIEEIAAVVSVDQALTARTLKLANSAYYGATHPATTLAQAIAWLGFRRTKNLFLAASYSSLLGRRLAGYNLGHGELWRHSVAVATVSQQLAWHVMIPSPDTAYLGGLLHDIGKLALDQHLKVDWAQLLALVDETEQHTLIEAEERLLGLNHAEVGGELATSWGLSSALVDVIAWHHLPTLASSWPKLAAIVHIADAVCLRLGIGLMHPNLVPVISPEALRLLLLDEDQVAALTQEYAPLLQARLAAEADIAITERTPSKGS
jgi:putative nucleotidyltransferase with HDIG domain